MTSPLRLAFGRHGDVARRDAAGTDGPQPEPVLAVAAPEEQKDEPVAYRRYVMPTADPAPAEVRS